MNRHFFLSLLALPFALVLPMALHAATVTPLYEGWRLQSACKLQAGGASISVAGYPVESWLKTSVPSTVLAAQVAAGVFSNPYFGDNLRKIPGTSYSIGQNFENLPMPADSPYHCGWWYRDEFSAPTVSMPGERFWLHFKGINYRADIWLNGHKIADSQTIAGAYRTYDLNITTYLKPGKENVLAVEAFAPTEKDLGINWVDWNPCPPDKDMGLTGAVNLATTGPVKLRSPMAVTHFRDDDLSTAYLTIYTELHNASGSAVKGVVSGTAAGAHFEQPVELAAHEDRTVVFTPEQFPALQIHNPRLWWPYQMGQPHLERLTMSFSSQGRQMDKQSVEFGMREITSELTANGGRLFRVNGKRILIRGGGWAQDMLLRTNPKRLSEQFEMVRDLHLNTIRLEGKLETDNFFRLADQEGILVMAGWCCCDRWEQWSMWTPETLAVATSSLRSQMLRLRSHPSLLVWLNGSDHHPTPAVERAYLQVESETHWPNPVLSSASATPSTVTGESGVKMTGPYDYVEPSYWYLDKHYGGAFRFITETSPGPAIVSLASRKKFLPDPSAWPPTADWRLHYGGGDYTNLTVFDRAMDDIYTTPNNAAEYTRMAQALEYDSERAMFEAYTKNKYDSTGVIQWMLNNAWPSMIWHLWDYNLDAGGGYYAVKKACEPLHIQYSYDDQSIVVVNSTYQAVTGLHAAVHVYNLDWKDRYSDQATVNAGPDSVQRVFSLPESLLAGADRIFFIDLTLSDATGHMVSHNFYWVPDVLTVFDWEKTEPWYTPTLRYPDLTPLTHLPQATVTARADTVSTAEGREIRLHLDNTSTVLVFQLSAAVRTSSGDLVAPVFWSDNWVEILPGESTTLTALLPDDAPANPIVKLEGWNIQPTTITPQAVAAAR